MPASTDSESGASRTTVVWAWAFAVHRMNAATTAAPARTRRMSNRLIKRSLQGMDCVDSRMGLATSSESAPLGQGRCQNVKLLCNNDLRRGHEIRRRARIEMQLIRL